MSNDITRRKQLLGYSNKLTLRAAETVEFKVSSEKNTPYTAQLVRLVNGHIHSKKNNYKEVEIADLVNKKYPGRYQPINPGSCVVVEDAQPFDTLDELTLTFSFMPTTPILGKQHLISRWNEITKQGWSIHLNDKGQLAFTSADSKGSSTVPIPTQPLDSKLWYTAALRVSWITNTITLSCTSLAVAQNQIGLVDEAITTQGITGFPEVECPLMMAAAFGGHDTSGRPIPKGCFNGRLEAPVVYRGLLSDAELACVASGARPTALAYRLMADWDFSDDISTDQIKDRSANRLNGYTHNLPLRAVKSSHWDGAEMNWKHAPEQYGAIHFHSDDLYDCGWLTDITYRLPDDIRSGIYALRLRQEGSEDAPEPHCEEYIPFFVAAPKNKPQSKLAFIVPTYSYLAYSNWHYAEIQAKVNDLSAEELVENSNMEPDFREYTQFINEHYDVGLSTYDHHSDGSPVHFSSWLRPLLNIRPKSAQWALCADLLFTDWLEAKGYSYDIITDDLLQEEGVSLLKNYDVVMSGNHPEYTSTEQLDAIASYTSQGGRFMYMGANGYYWRIAVNNTLPGVIEVRRGRYGSGTWQSEVGETHLAFTGENAGIWRENGRPAQQLFGVGTIAMCGASHYRITPEARESRAAFILEGVDDEIIGDFGILGGGAAGMEIDQTSAKHGTPSHTVVLARSENHGPGGVYVIEEMEMCNPLIEHYRPLMYAEVVFFETPSGGAVFAVGSMNWFGSLGHNNYDNNISAMTANVINRFLNPEPFEL